MLIIVVLNTVVMLVKLSNLPAKQAFSSYIEPPTSSPLLLFTLSLTSKQTQAACNSQCVLQITGNAFPTEKKQLTENKQFLE